MSAGEIRSLAVRAGIGPGVSVLDLCCGVAGPGRLISRELGCDYLGVDCSPGAIAIARERAGDLTCRFRVSTIPPVPAGPFDVVLLLEAMLAFRDKDVLFAEVAAALADGGRFVCTVEEGRPLTGRERALMPNSETVWPIPLTELRTGLERAGLRIRWLADHTALHGAAAGALTTALATEAPGIAARLGSRTTHELLVAHRLWSEWLSRGRVRKLAVVAVK